MPPQISGKPGGQSFSFKVLATLGFAVVCLGLFMPRLIGVQATSEPSQSPPVDANPPVYTGTISLLLLIGGGVAVAWFGLKRYGKERLKPITNSNLETLASLAIDPRVVIHLVRIGDRRLLVGLDAGGVKAVAELPETGPSLLGPERVPAFESLLAFAGGERNGRPE
jgi:flagellar biogenesis protein FliO